MKRKILLTLILAILAATLAVAMRVQTASAAVQEFHLYGSYIAGWSFSPSAITSPGPTVTVNLDDVVNLTLTNVDTGLYAPTHQFLLSYHNSSTPQPGDSVSPNIDAGQTIVFTFTANVSGTFTYYCTYHPSLMYGTFVVTPAIPEFPSLIVLSSFMIAIVAAASFYRRRILKQLP